MKALEVNPIVSEQNVFAGSRKGQLLYVRPAEFPRIPGSNDHESACSQDRGHYDGNILIKVERDRGATHPCGMPDALAHVSLFVP
jgi:hypothetical protein